MRHIRRWISRKPLEVGLDWFQKTTDRKMAYRESNGHVTDDVTWPERSNSWSWLQYA